jgi:hypothetical protein
MAQAQERKSGPASQGRGPECELVLPPWNSGPLSREAGEG